MPPRKRLRAVTDAEAAPRRRPMTLAEAIESGDYLAVLVAQRREMVRDVKEERGPAKAAMHRQIALLSKEIAALQAAAMTEDDGDGEAAPDEPLDASAF